MKTFLLFILLTPALTFSQFFVEDFEGSPDATTDLPTGWTETGLSTDGIYSSGDATAASSTYLAYPAHTTFAYTNDDACNCDKSQDRLILPPQDFSAYTVVNMSFSYYLNGGYGETATVEVSTDGGATWTVEAAIVPSVTDWIDNQIIDLSTYASNANVLISFLYNDNSTWAYSLGIDDVVLADEEILSTDDISTSEIGVFPNPTNNILNVANVADFSKVTIHNILGQKVLSIEESEFNGSINVSNLRNGVYLLSIDSKNGQSHVTRFVKE